MDPPMSARSAGPSGRGVFADTAKSVVSPSAESPPPLPAWGDLQNSPGAGRAALSEEDRQLAQLKACFFPSEGIQKKVQQERCNYPRRVPQSEKLKIKTGLEGDEDDKGAPRRIMGFGLGFEKIFATTSIKLPVTAYTIYAELHLAHKHEVYSRVFNGLNTVFDLKKWVFEKLWVPLSAYDLSYAEPGKATLTDNLRLLTTEDSIDTRTLATTRAVHRTFKGLPGVHSIGDIGVTRLYVRLKCRKCGDLLNSLQTCRKFKTFGHSEAVADFDGGVDAGQPASQQSQADAIMGNMSQDRQDEKDFEKKGGKSKTDAMSILKKMTMAPTSTANSEDEPTESRHGVPGRDPNIEDCWYRPDEKKHCLFHSRGYEMFEGARTHGGHAELARIYISCGKEPSKKLRLASQVLSKDGAHTRIAY
jgi:hypothetical protein